MSDAALVTDVSFAVTAAVATFFSPCAYPLLPGYVGFFVSRADGETASLSGSAARGVTAGAGVLVTLGLIAWAMVRTGRAALPDATLVEALVGAVLVAFGLLVAAGRAPSVSVPLPKRRSGVLGFGVFGAGYALASAGCVAPVFGAVVVRASTVPSETAAVLIGVYAGTVALLMAATTVAAGVGLASRIGRLAAHTGRLERAAGVVMALAGAGQLYLALVVF